MNNAIYLILSAIFLIACSEKQPKAKVSLSDGQKVNEQKIPNFNKKESFIFLLSQTNFGPRNPGSDGHQNCLNYLQKELNQLADNVSLQTFIHRGYDGHILKLSNIIASFKPDIKKRILFLAHWDTRPRADQDITPKKRAQPILGANDAASGVAVLLEIAHLLKMAPPSVGIDIVLLDGEDYGKEGDLKNYLLGSKYFAKNLPRGYSPLFGILLDMIGDKQLEIRREPNSIKYAPDIVDLVWERAKYSGIDQFSDNIQNPVTDDHIPLNEIGIRTIDLIDFNYPDETNRYWHTTEDTPDKCSPESLEAVGTVLVNIIYNPPE